MYETSFLAEQHICQTGLFREYKPKPNLLNAQMKTLQYGCIVATVA